MPHTHFLLHTRYADCTPRYKDNLSVFRHFPQSKIKQHDLVYFDKEDALTQRLQQSKPLLESIWAWFDTLIPTLSAKSPLAGAIQYALNQWDA